MIELEEPTLKILVAPNTSPFAGREGKFSTARQIEERLLKEKKVKNIELYRLYPSSVATSQLLDLYKKGVVEAPTTLESVVNVAIDLLSDKTPSRDAFVGYVADKGILAAYYTINFNTTYNNPHVLNFLSEKIIDPKYTP